MIQHTAVESSHIASIGYDSVSRILEMKFKNGSTYQYHDVPPEHYQGLMEADSKGDYHNQNIKTAFKSRKK